jgi:hypothetical protein
MKGRKHHAKGGMVAYAGGDSNVAHEAEEVAASHETNDETPAESRAKAKFKPYKKGGKAMHHKRGGKVHHAEGGKAMHRLDRKGRKTGGRVGADKSPLSSAHSSMSADRD